MDRPKTAPEILSGWKEIASYLGKGIRTVQRYERNLALPIRRPAGHPSGAVMATKAEIDAWVSASPLRASFPVSPVITGHTAALKELRRKIAEMKGLLDESVELRDQLRARFELLEESIRNVLPGETQLAQSSLQSRILADVLSFNAKKRVQ